jgi:CheY-like chemotaxis protein
MDRILVVDDEPDIVNLARRILEKEGYSVTSASDGDEALGVLERERIDLVLLDIVMPGKSGLEVCKIIKEQPKTRNIPVVMFNALGREVDRKLASWAGADAHLTKPFDKLELVEGMRSWLREARASAFSRRLGITHERMRGRKALLEVDPRSDYEKAVKDFVTEYASNKVPVLVVTRTGSAVRQCLTNNGNVNFLNLDAGIILSRVLNDYPNGDLSIVFDSLTDLSFMMEQAGGTSHFVRFIENVLEVLSDSRVTALFLLNSAALDARSVARIRGLFNNQFTYDAEGMTVVRQA